MIKQSLCMQELYRSKTEEKIRDDFYKLFKKCPIPEQDFLSNLGLFISSKNLSRILFIDFLYKQIINTHGIIIEFGTRWGQNLALFSALRGIYEPFNRMRKIVGFDTFTGFPNVSELDNRKCKFVKKGGLGCSDDYEIYLESILKYHEDDNPVSHIKKFEIIKGDACLEIKKYFKRNPETIVALAYFDFDIYKPTKECLLLIKDKLVKGSVIVFDELSDPDSPGETLALQEVIGLNNIKLRRFQYTSRVSYYIVGE